MIKGSIQEEEVTVVTIYTPNAWATQYIRQMPTAIKGEIDMYTLLYLKQTTNEDLLSGTGNSTQYSVDIPMYPYGKRIWKRICVTESLCYTPEINTTL